MRKEAERFADGTLFEGMVSLRTVLSDGAKRQIKTVFIDEAKTKKKAKELSYIKAKSYELGYNIEYLPTEKFEEMVTGTSHGGIAALCTERVIPSLSKKNIKSKGFYVMVEGIEDPYNFGYALRSLYAAGVDGIILTERNWMSAAGTVCRASAGASELFDVYVSTPEDAVITFKNAGYSVVGADIANSSSVYESELKYPLFLIVGGEKRGISAAILERCDKIVRLDYGRECPFALSAASAASILGFEIMRQNKN